MYRRAVSGQPADARLDVFARVVSTAGAAVLVLTLASMAAVLIDASFPMIEALGTGALTQPQAVGMTPPFVGTMLSAGLAVLIAAPLSLGTALYLTFYAPLWVARLVGAILDVLSAMPTLVFGMWGLAVLGPMLGTRSVNTEAVGVLVTAGGSVVLAALVLAAMLLPYLSSMARRLLSEAPTSLREAATALGATKWEMIRHVILPHAKSALFGATLLGLGRAMGEATAIIFVVGNRPPIVDQVPATTIATTLLGGFSADVPTLHLSSLALLALLLLAFTVLIHGLGRLLIQRSLTGGGML